jgi:hypothetical protein
MAQLIGTAPSQVPTNGDLGSAAYMDSSAFYGTGLNPVFRNRIGNGAMLIDQRRQGSALTNVTGGMDAWLVDRFRIGGTAMSSARMTWQQVTDAPVGSGLYKSAKITVTATQTPNPSDIQVLSTFVEANNMIDFEWGSTGAKTAVLSFWIKASVIGLYSVALRSDTGNNSAFVATYTVNTANTWEYKSIVIPGPASVGTWATGTGVGVRIDFDLGSGSSANISDAQANQWLTADYFRTISSNRLTQNSSATWQITGLQLEKGTVATPFEHLPIGVNLALCQRYCYVISGDSGFRVGQGWAYSSTSANISFNFPVVMRSSPALTNASAITYNDQIAGYTLGTPILNAASTTFATLQATGGSGMTSRAPGAAYFTNNSSYIILSSEY